MRGKDKVVFTTLKDNPEYLYDYVRNCKLEWVADLDINNLEKDIDAKIKKIKDGDTEIISVVIMLINNNFAGFISLFKTDYEKYDDFLSPWIATFFVKDEYRKNGYGKDLFQKIIDETENLGYDIAYFRSYIDNYYDKYFGAEIIEELDNGQKLYKLRVRNK